MGMAVLLAVGGTAAYVRTGSRASMAASAAFAGLYLGAAALTARYGMPKEGHAVGAAAGGTLTLVMGGRALRSGKVMPAGVVALFGAASAVYEYTKYAEWSA